MPHGARIAGIANGPRVIPRLVSEGGASAVPNVPVGQDFVPTGHDTVAIKTGPGSGALATATLGPVPQNEQWQIERIAIATNSGAPTTAKIYLGSVDPANIVDQTNNGESDVADQTNPILVPSGQTLIVQWTGISDGAVGSARFQFKRGTYQQTPFMGG